jgi:hypothetical protein
MSDKILARYILEGLMHNVNNHMNLILGYSQKLSKSHPEIKEAQKIFNAGILIDDALKDLSRQLWERSFSYYEELDLCSWLQAELDYLQNYLPIKHQVVFEINNIVESKQVFISKLDLAMWYESRLLILSGMAQTMKLKTGVIDHEGNPALYLAFSLELSPEQIDELLAELVCELIGDRHFPIISRWDNQNKQLLGVIHER